MKKALLAVFFGTARTEEIEKSIVPLERALAAAAPERQLFRAFTSAAIIELLRSRESRDICSVAEALSRLAEDGFESVLIQPCFITMGREWVRLREEILPFKAKFSALTLGKPLLSCEEDIRELAAALLPELAPLRADRTTIFVAHGVPGGAGAEYALLERRFAALGRADVHVGALYGSPGLEKFRAALPEETKEIILYPLMLSAGRHTQRDIAGENSWKSSLERAGCAVDCVFRGLGEMEGVRRIFVKHALSARISGGENTK